jgi:hypothetical protein
MASLQGLPLWVVNLQPFTQETMMRFYNQQHRLNSDS